VPAVQVSSSKAGVKVDSALMASVEDALKAASITYHGDALDATGIKVRFADLETQLKAKDVLQAKLGPNYIVALNLLSASPRWLTTIGAKPMYHGLDLRGGVHFLLQVDMKAALDKAGDRYTTDIRSLLRENKVQYSGVAREGRASSCAATKPSGPRHSESRKLFRICCCAKRLPAMSCGSSRD
jgi:preprotein translocase subunit SecD